MSSESRPITTEAFADALTALPLPSVYAKALEIHNSMAHLQRSNAELRQFIDESQQGGDEDCEEAIRENEDVITRMDERLELVKTELEGRGQDWAHVNGAPEEAGMETKEGEVGGEEEGQAETADAVETADTSNEAAQPRSGLLNGHRDTRDAPNDNTAGESIARQSEPREERDPSDADGGIYL